MRIFKMLFYSWHNNETIRLRLGSAASQKIGTFSKHDGNVNGSLLCRLFFSPSPTRRKKITSADPSDLLSSNMGIWRCNCFLGQSEFTFQILLSDATAANLAIITSKWSLNRFVELEFWIALIDSRRVTYQDLEYQDFHKNRKYIYL